MNSPDHIQNMNQEEITRLVEKEVSKGNRVLAAILFGSFPQEGFSDIDVCIVLYPGKYENLYLSEKRLELMMALEDFDIQIFQQLPLYIRIRVLKGTVIFCREEKVLYEVAIQTIREFEDYKKIYDEYLRGVVDEERILAKIAELDEYLHELEEISPKSYKEYKTSIEKKRACERLLHISIECVLDICGMLASELKLGLPSTQEDLFIRLESSHILSSQVMGTLKKMKSFRNIVHRYGIVNDELVYKILKNLGDFLDFKKEILEFLKKEDF